MAEQQHVSMTRDAYDTVASNYAELLRNELDGKPYDRALLAAFAESVPSGRVLEVGCGPGRIAAHLHGLGVDVAGMDLSPNMIDIARRDFPQIRFSVGSMTGLPAGDSDLSGIVAWYSIIHTPPEQLSVVFAEFYRVLKPDGLLVLAFQCGGKRVRLEQVYGHTVSMDAYRLDPDRVCADLDNAGFVVDVRVNRPPGASESTPQEYVVAHKLVR